MTPEFKSKHQDIAGILTSTTLNEVLEEGRDFTDMDFSEGEQQVIPKLISTFTDVHVDLENLDIDSAVSKLTWYFTKGPYADAQTEEEMQNLLGQEVSGAYAINTDAIAEKHMGLLALYHKLQKLKGKTYSTKQGPTTIYGV